MSKTKQVLDKFFDDCVKFWDKQDNKQGSSFELAINDVKNINSNPFSPSGEKLDATEKKEWLAAKTK